MRLRLTRAPWPLRGVCILFAEVSMPGSLHFAGRILMTSNVPIRCLRSTKDPVVIARSLRTRNSSRKTSRCGIPTVLNAAILEHFGCPPWGARFVLREVANNRLHEYGTQLGGHATTFWPASNFSVTEDLVDVAQVLGTQQLVYVTPPGTFDGEDYIWNASNVQLGPVFKSTDPDASAAQSDNAFFSGIFLGIAGGAAIALLGELPGEIPLPNWLAHRKRTHK